MEYENNTLSFNHLRLQPKDYVSELEQLIKDQKIHSNIKKNSEVKINDSKTLMNENNVK